MKTLNIILLSAMLCSIFVFQACEKEDKNETKISAHNKTESHNAGQNCMACHKQGGSGEGWFNVAATVYNSNLTTVYPNTTVKLYTGPNGTGTLKYVIPADANGNFYTTEDISFGSGLYPAVSSTNGTQYMSTSITSGNCASCHGGITDVIWAN